MLNIRGIDVTKFLKLVPFLKKKKNCWVSGEKVYATVVTRNQLNLLLEKASDENYLLWKVGMLSSVMISISCIICPFFRSF
jgi:hypothetical protein